jgi:hypothetical protein
MFEQLLSNEILPRYISALLVTSFLFGSILFTLGFGAALLSSFFRGVDYMESQAWNAVCLGGGMVMPLFLPLLMSFFAGEEIEIIFMLKLSIPGGAIVVAASVWSAIHVERDRRSGLVSE